MINKGRIKWFSFEKGYGFIIPDMGGREVFVHSAQLTDEQRSLMLPDTVVYYEVIDMPRGPMARNLQVDKHFETWYLPKPCSHRLAVKDHHDNEVAVFHTHDEMGAWISRKRNRYDKT